VPVTILGGAEYPVEEYWLDHNFVIYEHLLALFTAIRACTTLCFF
jgi:hypothetical protein